MAMAVSSQKTRDAALLRATTELYLLDPQHDRDEMRRFEELATHFLGKVTAADRAFVAERLARHPDAPPSVLRMLGKDLIEVASPILRHAGRLSSFDLIAIMAATGPLHYRLIAARPDLSDEVVAALRLTGDPETIALLPAARAEIPAPAVPPILATTPPIFTSARQPLVENASPPIATARGLAEALSADFNALIQDLTPKPAPAVPSASPLAKPVSETVPVAIRPAHSEPSRAAALPNADGFLSLGREARLAMLERFASATGPASARPSPLDIDRAFHAAVNRARVPALARQRQRSALIETMAAGLDLAPHTVQAFVDDESGEALVVLLKAIGLTDAEAQQVLLLANPAIGEAVGSFFRLVGLFSRLDRQAADRLVRHWRQEAKAGPSAPVPRPAEASQIARSARPLATRQPVVETEIADRTVFGKRGS
jgi:hypothetical protein